MEIQGNNLSGQSLDDAIMAAFVSVPTEDKPRALRLVEVLVAEQAPCALPRPTDQQ